MAHILARVIFFVTVSKYVLKFHTLKYHTFQFGGADHLSIWLLLYRHSGVLFLFQEKHVAIDAVNIQLQKLVSLVDSFLDLSAQLEDVVVIDGVGIDHRVVQSTAAHVITMAYFPPVWPHLALNMLLYH